MTAERFDAVVAAKMGLVSEVVSEAELDKTVEQMTVNLLANGPVALSTVKQLLRDIRHQPIDAELMQKTSLLIANIRRSEEGQEGLNAFLEKRSPNWIADNQATMKER